MHTVGLVNIFLMMVGGRGDFVKQCTSYTERLSLVYSTFAFIFLSDWLSQ
jgi:hypothetical protein